MEDRGLNALEAMFVKHNVRFAARLSPPIDVSLPWTSIVGDRLVLAEPTLAFEELELESVVTEPFVAAVGSSLVINANHALLDGRALQQILAGQACLRTLALDWTDLVRPRASRDLLPLVKAPKLVELMPGDGGRDVRIDLDVVKVSGATVTGLLVAAFHAAIGGPVSVSVIVDMRPLVERSDELLNAPGAVTVGSHVDVREDDVQGVVDLARTVTSDIKRRIARGEAHFQALAMAEGRFSDLPEATLELSNHGIYKLPTRDSRLDLSQRFEGYVGASICAHTEDPSGIMRLAASIGGVDRDAIVDLLGTVKRIIDRVKRQAH